MAPLDVPDAERMSQISNVLAGNKGANVRRLDRALFRPDFGQEGNDYQDGGLELRVELPGYETLAQNAAEIESGLKHQVMEISESLRYPADHTVRLRLGIDRKSVV